MGLEMGWLRVGMMNWTDAIAEGGTSMSRGV